MLGFAGVGEQAGVHARVQRLDPPVEALGEAGELLDGCDGHARVGDPFAVEPVETISTPSACSPVASSSSPALS